MHSFEWRPLKSRLCLLPLAEVIDIHPWICAVLSFCKVTELLIADPIELLTW